MASITVRQVVNTYFTLKLGPKYRHLKNQKHDRLEKICLDVFAYHGIEVSLNSKEKQEAFLGPILHMETILRKIQEKLVKHPKRHSVEDVFPNSGDFFYKELNPVAAFIVKPPQGYHFKLIPSKSFQRNHHYQI